MARLRNAGATAVEFSGGFILPGHVKDVPDDEAAALLKAGGLQEMPVASIFNSRRPRDPVKGSAVGEVTPMVPGGGPGKAKKKRRGHREG